MSEVWNPEYDEYLRDESRRSGVAQSISFPVSEAEVVDTIKRSQTAAGSITTQGARTGIVAGAVPQGGHILNLSRMKAVGEVKRDDTSCTITVQPGALLTDIQEALAPHGLYFPPDPTETSASIGGMVASNASGACTLLYGPTRNWVERLRVVLADGDMIDLKRGDCRAHGRTFSLTTESGRVIAGALPSYAMPSVKSAAGYYAADDMDMIDLFIGMEGTLGVIIEIGLRLIPAPKAINGLTIFLSSEEAALKSVRILRGEPEPLPVQPAAIEFFNSDALDLLRNMRTKYSAFEKIPALKPSFHTALYTEFHGESNDALEETVLSVMEALADLGVNEDDTWFATTPKEMAPLKAFRHATPEAVNLLIDERRRTCPELTKLGTDMSVPDQHLESMMEMYATSLEESGLESVVFGHIGNNHVHVNILPHNLEEYDKGKSMYFAWAERVVQMGGSVSAEHGIGKLKAPFLKLMYGEEAISEMRALKMLFDPQMLLNPGNLFSQ